jgi:hypothetical protein
MISDAGATFRPLDLLPVALKCIFVEVVAAFKWKNGLEAMDAAFEVFSHRLSIYIIGHARPARQRRVQKNWADVFRKHHSQAVRSDTADTMRLLSNYITFQLR